MILTVPIWDMHKEAKLSEDGGLLFIPVVDNGDDKPWKKFNASFDTDQLGIDIFKEDVIFQKDVPVPVVRLFLSDGSELICRNTLDTIINKYQDAIIKKE